jgi:GAF domain-containing protein
MDGARMLADMALELEQDRDPTTILERVSHYARLVLDADDAGVMRTVTRSQIETPAATTARVDQAHQLQARFDEGPCLDAIEGRATYVTNDVPHDSLNVYADRTDAFTPADIELAEMLAAHATTAFAAAERAAGLETALDSRTTIAQAQGILMQKFDIDADAAFDFLRRISQHENRRLFTVAEAIVVQRNANARPE